MVPGFGGHIHQPLSPRYRATFNKNTASVAVCKLSKFPVAEPNLVPGTISAERRLGAAFVAELLAIKSFCDIGGTFVAVPALAGQSHPKRNTRLTSPKIACNIALPMQSRALGGGVVPGGGVEPPRPEDRRILSPLRIQLCCC